MQAIRRCVGVKAISSELYHDVIIANREVANFKFTIELDTALTALGENNLNDPEGRAAAGIPKGQIVSDDLFVAAARGYILGLMHGKREERAKRSR